MVPKKLKQGDEVRIISPARSMTIISKEARDIATKKLEEIGLKVSFSKHAGSEEVFNSAPVKSRVSDLHDAYLDKNVKAILTTIGGFNSNQMLDHIDYNIIKSNPKILCGYSDITALNNAIYAKTGVITYSGPHFSTFGMKKGLKYTVDYFKKCLFSDSAFEVKSSKKWSEDAWYKDQENRKFKVNKGAFVINSGAAKGKIIGGNLCTFILLNGTQYKPDFKDSILFIEDCVEEGGESFPEFCNCL